MRAARHGELQRNPVSFSGRDRVHVKRKALDYWFHNKGRLGLSLREFLLQCRLSNDGRTIVFLG